MSLAFNLYQVPRTAFNPDESRWIHRAHYLVDLGDPFGPTWDDRYLTRGQPPLGSYVTGLGLLVQGRNLTTNGSWDFAYDAATNAELGNMPTYDDLMTARRTSAMLMALTVAMVFVIGSRLTNWIGGLAGALALAIHPFSSYIGSLATADALFGLLIALAALAALRLAEHPTWPRALTLGALLGLGAATKLSPLFLAVPIALLGGLMLVAGWRWNASRDRSLGWRLLSVPVVTVVTFVAVYPYLWLDPLTRTLNLFAFRVEEMSAQSSDWPEMAVPTRGAALARVGQNFEERFSIAGRLEATVGAAIGSEIFLPRFELALAIAGLIVLAAIAIRRGLTSQPMLALAVLGGQVGITIAGMRSEFDRYHLPMAILAAVCIGLLIGTLATAAARLSAPQRRRRIRSQPPLPVQPAPGFTLPGMTTNRRQSVTPGRR